MCCLIKECGKYFGGGSKNLLSMKRDLATFSNKYIHSIHITNFCSIGDSVYMLHSTVSSHVLQSIGKVEGFEVIVSS